MNNKANIQCNTLMKLDDTMLMYGIYNAETLEELINLYTEFITQHLHMKNYLQANIIILYLEYSMHTL